MILRLRLGQALSTCYARSGQALRHRECRAGLERGMVLVVTLWMMTFLAVIGGTLLVTAVTDRRTVAVELDQTQAEYLALAAMTDVGEQAARYFALPPDERALDFLEELRTSGILDQDLALGAGTVRIGAEDECAKLAGNAASEAVLTDLATFIGVPAAGRLAEALVKWRQSARPLMAVGELALIPGMTPATAATLASVVTLYTDGKINPNTASDAVLAATAAEWQRQWANSRQAGAPPPDAATLKAGRPWTNKKLQADLKQWAPSLVVQPRIYHLAATGTVRGRSCTLHWIVDVVQMAAGAPPVAEWRTYEVRSTGKMS